MLVFAGLRAVWQHAQARLHGHSHDGSRHVHRVDDYGPKAAFGVGVIHGIGAETGTQVLIIATAGGAASQGLGLWMLLAFALGLVLSNSAIALFTSLGFVTGVRARTVQVTTGCLAAAFSLFVGTYFFLGAAGSLPDLPAALGPLAGGTAG
jgi:high-affinity nickel-transport protein